MIEWFARNPVAANLLMIGIVLAGLISASRAIPIEAFPSRETDEVTIVTAFRGATPKTTEDGITLRIEEAIADIEGIEKITSRSQEGLSSITAEIDDRYDIRDLLDDIKVRVDALNTLPREAEKPIVSITTRSRQILSVAIMGDVGKKTLRETASKFRQGLLTNDGITNVQLQGVANYEINIQVSPETLDNYNLTIEQIGRAIRNGASDVSAGNVQTPDGDILVRSDGQAYTASEFAQIPIIPNAQGNPVRLGEIATIIDGFEESSLITKFNGKHAIMIEVLRVGDQSALQVAETTKAYIEEFSKQLPSGVSIDYWNDSAKYLQSRINAVLDSALLGGLLVIILLSLFLRPAVAFWVFLGIPVSFMGAFLFMPQVGGTFNVVSLFAFILVIGIVVDDAIVTGENIYRKIREGLDPMEASISGTKEITMPVTFGILTTVAAFIPLNYLSGTYYDFIGSQMPMVVIPILLMSLIESKLVLPSHMTKIQTRDPDSITSLLARIQTRISRGLEQFVEEHYRPFLKKCIVNKTITLTLLLAISGVITTAAYLGHIRFAPFPTIESNTVRIFLTMPESTGFETTNYHIQQIANQFEKLRQKYTDPETNESVIQHIYATSGSSGRTVKSNLGAVYAELQSPEERAMPVSASQIASDARKLIGEVPGAQSLSVRASVFNFGAPINVELYGAEPARMYEVIKRIKEKLRTYPGVYDLQDNYSGGKEEFKLNLKPRAYLLGLRLNQVAGQVRNAVFGFEAQRIQRDRDELRVMVRYPLENRSSIEDLNQLTIKVPGENEEVLLSEVADIVPFESPSTLYRLDRRSVVNVTADVDKNITNTSLVLNDLENYLVDLRQEYPDVQYRFDGEAEDARKTNTKLSLGALAVLIAIYILLAIPFRSYSQPLIVMVIIPFALIGAVIGHVITFQNLSILSVFGMLALVGVVVNDSLVLVDYINKLRTRGLELVDAVIKAATTRFRPVLLTSITTFAGLAPILMDGSQQAKWLKPMATSLAFGIVFATLITLIITPVNYIVARNAKHKWLAFWNKSDLDQYQYNGRGMQK